MIKKKSPLSVLLSLIAALLVYECGKIVALWCMQSVGKMVRFSNAVLAEESAWNGFCSLAMQLGGGGICLLLWRKELVWGAGDRKKKQFAWMETISLAGLAVASALGLNLLLSLLQVSRLSASFQETAASQAAVPVWLGIVLYGFAAPFSEEVLFRGLIYGRVRLVFPPFAAMAFSGLIFGIYHGNLVQGIYAAILGTALCFIYEKCESLTAPIFFHGIANLTVYLALDVWPFGNWLLENVWLGIASCAVLLGAAAGGFWRWFGKGQ